MIKRIWNKVLNLIAWLAEIPDFENAYKVRKPRPVSKYEMAIVINVTGEEQLDRLLKKIDVLIERGEELERMWGDD